jgi:hypothetical protein
MAFAMSLEEFFLFMLSRRIRISGMVMSRSKQAELMALPYSRERLSGEPKESMEPAGQTGGKVSLDVT